MPNTHRPILFSAALVAAALLAGGCHSDKPAETKPAPSPAKAAEPKPAAPETKPTDTSAPHPIAAQDVPKEPNPSTAPAALPATDPALVAGPDAYEAKALNRIELASGLIIEDLKIGTGPSALPKARLTFHYRSKIQGGEQFDATIDHDGHAPLNESMSRLFVGLADGLVGIQPGGRRRLTIPGGMAPGIAGLRNEAGEVVIPADATLIYVVDVLDVKQTLITTPAPTAAPTTTPAKP